METTKNATPASLSTNPRAQQLAEAIAGRLFNDGARNIGDAELQRVLSPCVGGNNLVATAKQLRDAGMLTLATEWISKRHRHSNEPGAVCACETPDPVFERGDVVIINAPKHEAHGLRARVVKCVPRTVGEAGAVYTVRVIGRKNVRAPYFDNEELTLAPGCEECNFRGWVEMTEEHSDDTRIERCDTCNVFATDDDALDAAEAEGWKAEGCLSCFSPKCGLCGCCHACEDDELRPACTRGEVL